MNCSILLDAQGQPPWHRRLFQKVRGSHGKLAPLNRMNVCKRGIPEGAWRLWSNTDNNIKKYLINNNSTKVSGYLIHNTNKCNNCRWIPTTKDSMYWILDTGATKSYIKVDTPCTDKFKTIQIPRVLLPDGSLMQATYREEWNPSPLLYTRAKIAHILTHLQ